MYLSLQYSSKSILVVWIIYSLFPQHLFTPSITYYPYPIQSDHHYDTTSYMLTLIMSYYLWPC